VTRAVCMGFVMDKVARGHFFFCESFIPCQYHSTTAPYSLMYNPEMDRVLKRELCCMNQEFSSCQHYSTMVFHAYLSPGGEQ
jgi:hypothetical protein